MPKFATLLGTMMIVRLSWSSPYLVFLAHRSQTLFVLGSDSTSASTLALNADTSTGLLYSSDWYITSSSPVGYLKKPTLAQWHFVMDPTILNLVANSTYKITSLPGSHYNYWQVANKGTTPIYVLESDTTDITKASSTISPGATTSLYCEQDHWLLSPADTSVSNLHVAIDSAQIGYMAGSTLNVLGDHRRSSLFRTKVITDYVPIYIEDAVSLSDAVTKATFRYLNPMYGNNHRPTYDEWYRFVYPENPGNSVVDMSWIKATPLSWSGFTSLGSGGYNFSTSEWRTYPIDTTAPYDNSVLLP